MRLLFIFILTQLNNSLSAQYRLYDLLITEFMADPVPIVALPNAEFVEIYNNTDDTISLLNWQLADATGAALIRVNYLFPPGEYLILCGNSNVNAFSVYGKTLGITGFPNLNNDEDKIILIAPGGNIIHQIHYTLQWYKDSFKEQGGFTIEMIDMTAPCLGETNYTSSVNISGGTPGQPNSVNSILTDTSLPYISNAFITDEQNVLVLFNKPMHPTVMGQLTIQSTPPEFSFSIRSVEITNDRSLLIQVNEYFNLHNTYRLTMNN